MPRDDAIFIPLCGPRKATVISAEAGIQMGGAARGSHHPLPRQSPISHNGRGRSLPRTRYGGEGDSPLGGGGPPAPSPPIPLTLDTPHLLPPSPSPPIPLTLDTPHPRPPSPSPPLTRRPPLLPRRPRRILVIPAPHSPGACPRQKPAPYPDTGVRVTPPRPSIQLASGGGGPPAPSPPIPSPPVRPHQAGNPEGRRGTHHRHCYANSARPPRHVVLRSPRRRTWGGVGLDHAKRRRYFHPLMWPSQGHRHFGGSRNPDGRGSAGLPSPSPSTIPYLPQRERAEPAPYPIRG